MARKAHNGGQVSRLVSLSDLLVSEGPRGRQASGKEREKWTLCECVPTLQRSATFQTIDVRSNIKIK